MKIHKKESSYLLLLGSKRPRAGLDAKFFAKTTL
jgi:hypothetical protein